MVKTESLTAVIIGAGHGAGELVNGLRDNGCPIILVGEEPYRSCHHPPLLKAYLLGEATMESLLNTPRSAYEQDGVEKISGLRVIQITPQASQAHLADGRQLKYDRLILATGGRPLPLAAATEMNASNGVVTAVLCDDGSLATTDLVVAGIGLTPNIELTDQVSLAVDGGVLVDEYEQALALVIYAAGDCTNRPNQLLGCHPRLELVHKALEQTRRASSSICARPKAYASTPWLWSDQYGLKLKMAGLSQGYDRLVLRGSTEHNSCRRYCESSGGIHADQMGHHRRHSYRSAKPGRRLLTTHRAVTGLLTAPRRD